MGSSTLDPDDIDAIEALEGEHGSRGWWDRGTVDPWEQPPDRVDSGRSISETFCDAINDYYAEHDKTKKEVAEDLGIDDSTVGIHLKGDCNHGVDSIDSARCRVICCMYDDGLQKSDIAERFGVSTRTVLFHVSRDCGCENDIEVSRDPIEHPDPDGCVGKITPEKCSEAEAMVDDGYKQTEVATHFGVHRGTINYHYHGRCDCRG